MVTTGPGRTSTMSPRTWKSSSTRFEQARVALEPGAVDLLACPSRAAAASRSRSAADNCRRARGSAGRARPCGCGAAPAGATGLRRLGDRDRRPRPGRSGGDRALFAQSRSCAARRGARAGCGGTGRRSSRFSSAAGRARNSRATRPASANSSSAASRAGPAICGLRIRPIAASTPCAAARPSAPPQPAGKARHRRAAGQAERNSEQHRADRRRAAAPRPIRPAGSQPDHPQAGDARSPAGTGREPSPNSSSSASLA